MQFIKQQLKLLTKTGIKKQSDVCKINYTEEDVLILIPFFTSSM